MAFLPSPFFIDDLGKKNGFAHGLSKRISLDGMKMSSVYISAIFSVKIGRSPGKCFVE
jgi:hypothetical protein